MARIRSIKPEFWQDEDLSQLPPETHMLAAALLNHADDEGYFKAHEGLVKAACCPLREDSTSIRRSLDELSSVGYITLYQAGDGKRYGHIRNFTKHQRVDRPNESKIAPLVKDLQPFDEDSTKDRRGFDEGSLPEQGTGNREQGGEQGKETPPKPPSPRGAVDNSQNRPRRRNRGNGVSRDQLADRWSRLIYHCRQGHGISAVLDDDPALGEAAKGMGGMAKLRRLSEQEIERHKQSFASLYREAYHSQQGETEQQP